jgi:hypothetical protein
MILQQIESGNVGSTLERFGNDISSDTVPGNKRPGTLSIRVSDSLRIFLEDHAGILPAKCGQDAHAPRSS